MPRTLLFLLFLLVALGCEPRPDAALEAADSTAVAAEAGETPSADAAPVLALEDEGLRLIDATTGTARPLPFGMDGADVLAVLTGLQGPPAEQGTMRECGAGPLGFARWPDGLTVLTAEGVFAGWSVDGLAAGADRYTTMSGIGVGTTRADLAAGYAAEVEETSLGTEFSAGGLYGLLAGPEPDAAITDLWAGTSCIFR